MTTFGNPHETYTSSSVKSNKERESEKQNAKEAKRNKKRKAQGKSVEKNGGAKEGKSTSGGSGNSNTKRKNTGNTNKKKNAKRAKSYEDDDEGGEEDGEDDDDDEDGDDGCDCSAMGSPSCAFAGFTGISGFAQILVVLAALGQMIVGIVHVFELFKTLDVCDDRVNGVDCVGDSLFWSVNGVSDTSSDLNRVWRSVFTFAPSRVFVLFVLFTNGFCDNWTPVIFGCLAIMQMFQSTQWRFISGTWLRTMFFIVVMMLFACFGYSGMCGVIFGFIQAIAGFLCLLCVVLKAGGTPYPTIGY